MEEPTGGQGLGLFPAPGKAAGASGPGKVEIQVGCMGRED